MTNTYHLGRCRKCNHDIDVETGSNLCDACRMYAYHMEKVAEIKKAPRRRSAEYKGDLCKAR